MAPRFLFLSLSPLFLFYALPALFSIASAINVIQRQRATHNNTYAITETWIRKAGTHTTDADMCCPLILSMRSALAAARKALPKTEARTTTIDLVLYTEKDSFGDDAVKFMESRGVQVVEILEDPIMSQVLKSLPSPHDHDENINVEKMSYLWDTRYDAVLEIDYDVFFVRDTAGTVDMLGTVAHGDKSMYTFTGKYANVAGGVLAVRPSEEFAKGVLQVVQNGNWTDADQGILFQLATDGQQDRRISGDSKHSWMNVGVWQPTLDPKPWELHKLPELIETNLVERVPQFRSFWKEGLSALLKDDAECTAYYQEQLDIYKTCYTEGMTSSQAKKCLEKNFA